MLAWLAACESRYGAYLTVKGDIRFDEVELYFGIGIDSSGPGSGSAFATPRGPQTGLIFDRKFDASDIVTLDATTETTFYMPPDEKNSQLGPYVVAVALAGGQPVGIAEYFDFAVPSDAVHQYILPLTAWNPLTMERWGERPGCVMWRQARDRDQVVAVVRADDRDCDALPRDMDCSDLCSAQSPACAAGMTFCNVSSFCALGCSLMGLCAPAMCLPDATCADPACAQLSGLDQRLACGRDKTTEHLELLLDRGSIGGNLGLCDVAYSFSPGLPCNQPMFVSLTPGFETKFNPKIYTTNSVPTECTLELTGPSTTIAIDETHHALISLAPQNVGPRVTFILGIKWSGRDQCLGGGFEAVPGGRVFDCK